jgi:molybdate transport system substrate-binding protein
VKLYKSLAIIAGIFLNFPVSAEKITIAAAADLKFAMDEIINLFQQENQGDEVVAVYGSSGKFFTQIQQGAPYDLYFSADILYPRKLYQKGFSASEVKTYAYGRIVLWSPTLDASKMNLADLTNDKITRIAIANPKHAPYGKRAEEALKKSAIWEKIEKKIVYGENIAHTAQFVQTGNAQIGLIALSLAVSPELSKIGKFWLIPKDLHEPLQQGYIITKRAEKNDLARRFTAYFESKSARDILIKFGFTKQP